MTTLISLMNGRLGRATRVALGVALIAGGLAGLGGKVGLVVAVVGLLPILMGVWGRCLLELVAACSVTRAQGPGSPLA